MDRITWSKQHQIKLRQRAAQVLEEVSEDESLVKEIMRLRSPLPPPLRNPQHQKESLWALSVLEGHRRLEALREKEYDLLFSEEAARLWQKREQEWQEEERAREALLRDVLEGRRQQLLEKMEEKNAEENRLALEKEEAEGKAREMERRIEMMERTVEEDGADDGKDCTATNGKDILLEKEEKDHRKEIARLEAEMARLWSPLYTPPVSYFTCLRYLPCFCFFG